MTVLEAWAVGVPVLGSDRGGIGEWINEYGGGWLSPPGDALALASMIEDIMDSRVAQPTIPENEKFTQWPSLPVK